MLAVIALIKLNEIMPEKKKYIYTNYYNGIIEFLNYLFDSKNSNYSNDVVLDRKTFTYDIIQEKREVNKCIDRKHYDKLEELYNKFFGYMPISDNLHNSLIDSIVTLRCFYRLANSPPKIALCGVGAPDVYLVAGEPMGPVEKTLQEYIQQDITPAGTDPNGVGGPVAPCQETILGGRRRRKTAKRSRRNKNKKTHRRLKRKSTRKH
jgi:hypothetical protein